jgi:hypothetical protein
MKGIVSALSQVPNAGAAIIGIFLSPFAKDPTFTYVYAGSGLASIITSVIFFSWFGKFDIEDYSTKKNEGHTIKIPGKYIDEVELDEISKK